MNICERGIKDLIRDITGVAVRANHIVSYGLLVDIIEGFML